MHFLGSFERICLLQLLWITLYEGASLGPNQPLEEVHEQERCDHAGTLPETTPIRPCGPYAARASQLSETSSHIVTASIMGSFEVQILLIIHPLRPKNPQKSQVACQLCTTCASLVLTRDVNIKRKIHADTKSFVRSDRSSFLYDA